MRTSQTPPQNSITSMAWHGLQLERINQFNTVVKHVKLFLAGTPFLMTHNLILLLIKILQNKYFLMLLKLQSANITSFFVIQSKKMESDRAWKFCNKCVCYQTTKTGIYQLSHFDHEHDNSKVCTYFNSRASLSSIASSPTVYNVVAQESHLLQY